MRSSSDNYKIIRAVRYIAGSGKVYSVHCAVTRIGSDGRSVDVEPMDGSPEILGVLLNAQTGPTTNGFTIVPKVGSIVTVTFLDDNTGFVSMFSEIDDMYMKVNTVIKVNGDNHSGMVRIADLVTKLNNLENAFNALVLKFNTHIHPAIDSITSAPITVTPTVSQDTTTLILTIQSDMENTTVKHGS